MKDKRSILKASGVDDLFAKMEETCRVPCEITLEGMAVSFLVRQSDMGLVVGQPITKEKCSE